MVQTCVSGNDKTAENLWRISLSLVSCVAATAHLAHESVPFALPLFFLLPPFCAAVGSFELMLDKKKRRRGRGRCLLRCQNEKSSFMKEEGRGEKKTRFVLLRFPVLFPEGEDGARCMWCKIYLLELQRIHLLKFWSGY